MELEVLKNARGRSMPGVAGDRIGEEAVVVGAVSIAECDYDGASVDLVADNVDFADFVGDFSRLARIDRRAQAIARYRREDDDE